MSFDIIEDEIRTKKNFLLENNPSKINATNQGKILAGLVDCFGAIFEPLRNETQGIPDRIRLLIVDSLSIWALRTTQLISHKKVDTAEYAKKVYEELLPASKATTIFQYVIDFWSDGTAAFINALRDMFGKLLKLIKLIYPSTESTDILTLWLNQTLEIPSTLRVQYYLINALSDELDLFSILQKRPDFIETSLSLMWSDSLSTPIGKCLTSLLINIYNVHFSKKVGNIEHWLKLWQGPVLKYLCNARFTKSIELYVMSPLFKNMPPEAFIEFSRKIRSSKEPLLIISIFKLGQELGIEEEPFHNDKLLPLKTVEEFFKQEQYKLQAFELLTYSTKKSRPIHNYIFEIVKENIESFFIDPKVETRNYFCSSFKHFLLRIRDSSYALNRTVTKLKVANKFLEEQEAKEREIKKCEDFLIWLIQYLKMSICPGTQYQMNCAAFKIFEVLVASGIDRSISDKYIDTKNRRQWPFSVPLCSQESFLRLLLDSLSSHYDDIRQSAKFLLLVVFTGADGKSLKRKLDWESIHQKSIIFLNSYQFSDIGANLQDIVYFASDNKPFFIERLLGTLKLKIENNISSYIDHIDEPIGGYFTSLSLILSESNLQYNEMRNVVDVCISFTFKNWVSVRSILCYDTSKETLPSYYKVANGGDQAVISTAFKAVKESSNLLNTLLSHSPLSSEQLTSIGDLLIEQLFSIYHSGAFQAVLPSFQSVCQRCHKENPAQIERWLKNITELLEVKTKYITRRSGGIPYMISTILSTETQKDHPLLKLAYTKLEKIASRPIEQHQDEIDLPQINAFNCIRAIFIESKLSEPCSDYISSALNLSLKNFSSDLWSLRNCSIMLFTSLQNRVFGKKGKAVGASQFFARFQGIREILLQLLKTSLPAPLNVPKNTVKEHEVESIFLVLNILLRLKPTPGYDGFEAFTKEIIGYLSNKNWKIRVMTARALAHMIDEPIGWVTSVLECASVANQNLLHGSLLTAIQVLEVTPNGDPSSSATIVRNIKTLINVIFSKENEFLSRNPCYITVKTYIELVLSALKKNLVNLEDKRVGLFICKLDLYFLKNDDGAVVDGSKQLCLATAFEVLLKYSRSPKAILCELGIRSQLFQVQLIGLRYAVNELDLTLPDYKDLVTAILELSKKSGQLPSVGALIIKSLENSKCMQFSEVLSILEDPLKSEEEQTSAIECIGRIANVEHLEKIEDVIIHYSDDRLPIDFRIASLECLKHFSGLKANPKLVIKIFEMLSDDDDTVRTLTAKIIEKTFIAKNVSVKNASPSSLAKELDQVLLASFSKEQIGSVVSQKVKSFLDSCEILALANEQLKGLFESERNNQFRNELSQNIKYIQILSRANYENVAFSDWVQRMKCDLITMLANKKVTDRVLGWASNQDVFVGLYILRLLIELTEPLQLNDFDRQLRAHDVHPMIFE